MTDSVSIAGAFLAGVVSFLSPCVLPLVPAYVAFISGKSIEELRQGKGMSRQAVEGSLLFILGFSAVFILMGASAAGVGRFLLERISVLTKIAGAGIILLGLAMAGLFRLPFLNRTFRFDTAGRAPGRMGSFWVGAAFAFGWTPCIGPILAAILAFAATRQTLGEGVVLLGVYSLGLGVPFFLTTLFLQTFFRWTGPVRRHFRAVEAVSGLLLVAVGILIFTGGMSRLTGYLAFFNRFSL